VPSPPEFELGIPFLYFSVFSPDGHWLACPSTNCGIRIWDLKAGRGKRLEGHHWGVIQLQFSGDSHLLASGGWDAYAAVWSVKDGRLLHGLLRGHQSGIGRVHFSSDGRTLFTVSDDQTLRLWSVATGQEMLRFEGVKPGFIANWNPADELLLWHDTQGVIQVTAIPTLAEIDATEKAQASATASIP
jgi:WD40 repeat protein